jgi:hypothetical protein
MGIVLHKSSDSEHHAQSSEPFEINIIILLIGKCHHVQNV